MRFLLHILQLCHISDPNPVEHLWVVLEQVRSMDDPQQLSRCQTPVLDFYHGTGAFN